jgi:hypothetical protein
VGSLYRRGLQRREDLRLRVNGDRAAGVGGVSKLSLVLPVDYKAAAEKLDAFDYLVEIARVRLSRLEEGRSTANLGI